jgi:hypothetical protein
MWKYFFSSLFLLASLAVVAQEKTAKDTTRLKFVPTGLRLGTDLLSIVRSQAGTKFSGWEAHADIDFTRYYLTAEYGAWGSAIALKNGAYSNEGNYWRLGADVNFLLKDPDRNMFFLGFRYGRSAYDQNLALRYTDAVFGEVNKTLAANQVEASWKELTGGLRVKVWKWIWMGYTARFKFGMNVKNEGNIKSYDVPGYGLTIKNNTWGFNYQLFVRLPIRKEGSRILPPSEKQSR